MFGGGGLGPGWGEAICSEVQYILGNGHMGNPFKQMTDTSENITFLQLRWLAVRIMWPQLSFHVLKWTGICQIRQMEKWPQVVRQDGTRSFFVIFNAWLIW